MIANFRRGRRLPPALGLGLILCALLCPPAWPAGPILTHEQLERLLKVVESKGTHTNSGGAQKNSRQSGTQITDSHNKDLFHNHQKRESVRGCRTL